MKRMHKRLQPAKDRVSSGDSWRGQKNGSSTARGYGYKWQQYRAAFLIDHPLCAMRGDGCELAATVVDHIVPHRGNMTLFWDPTNHQAVCTHCHNEHKQKMENIAQR